MNAIAAEVTLNGLHQLSNAPEVKFIGPIRFKPSVSALKFASTRCLKIGIAKELMSSIFGVGRPSRIA